MAGRRDREVVRGVLVRLGLAPLAHRQLKDLSGGEQQRVAIARALINDPVLILADEPTGNLDAQLADEIMQLFLNIRKKGATIILASHDVDFITRYASRILSLRQGCLIDDLRRVKTERAR